MHSRLRYTVWIFTLIGGFALGGLTSDLLASNESDHTQYRLFNLLGEAFERVRDNYVEDVDDQVLIEAAIKGMMGALDPYSNYLDSKNFSDMQDRTRGQFGGLGLEVTLDESGYVRVVSPIDDTPAARAGLQPDDLITHIDDTEIIDMRLNQAVEKMRGPVDSEIEIQVLRNESEILNFNLIREFIRIRSVRSRIEADDIGYIRISSFSSNTGRAIRQEIDKLNETNPNLVGYIVDLRNNPGGLLDEAVRVSDGFLNQGEIVSIRGRDNRSIQRFQAKGGDWSEGKKIVVLINRGSASASEILAGALQDHQRATIIGTNSFGKGSVQTIIPLQQNNAALKLTTQHYYTPSGRSIAKIGLKPDIVIKSLEPIRNDDGTLSPPEKDVQLEKAVEFLKLKVADAS